MWGCGEVDSSRDTRGCLTHFSSATSKCWTNARVSMSTEDSVYLLHHSQKHTLPSAQSIDAKDSANTLCQFIYHSGSTYHTAGLHARTQNILRNVLKTPLKKCFCCCHFSCTFNFIWFSAELARSAE